MGSPYIHIINRMSSDDDDDDAIFIGKEYHGEVLERESLRQERKIYMFGFPTPDLNASLIQNYLRRV